MIWNNRFTRIGVGVLLLGAGIVAILPGMTGHTSLDGTVNARFTAITAPIDGTVDVTPPRAGTALGVGDRLLTIRNERVNRAVAASLLAELETARRRLDATDVQRGQLVRLRDDLTQRLEEFRAASIRNLEQEIAVVRERIGMNAAQRVAADSELQRRETLGVSGIVAGSAVEQARAAQITSAATGRVAQADLQRLTQQLEAVRRGIFTGDGRNDVPYSRQRQDEVLIQLAELDARVRESEARVTQLEKQLAQETNSIQRLEAAVVTMPFDGVVWRNNVVAGSNVIAGNELLQILDCSDLFVDILVSEVDYDEIFPGRQAQVRLLGRDVALDGEVTSVRGSAAVIEERTLAATPPQSRERSARIRIALPVSQMNRDYGNYCQVGRSVQVRFETRNLPLRRWFNAIWFSIF